METCIEPINPKSYPEWNYEYLKYVRERIRNSLKIPKSYLYDNIPEPPKPLILKPKFIKV